VSAFAIVFVGVMVILWRRRQAYLQSNSALRHVELSHDNLDKLSVMGEGGTGIGTGIGGNGIYAGSDPDLEPYNTSNTDEDEEEMEHGGHTNNYNNNKIRDSSLYINRDGDGDGDDVPPMNGHANGGHNDDHDDDNDDEDLPSPTEDGQSETMQFDLGNSFKDQLLGLHGLSANGQQYLQQPHNANGKRGGLLMSNVLFRQSGQSMDGDSDADSWAQTDGTIGSLELQLEPITAEV
jgi:hypothetical protein